MKYHPVYAHDFKIHVSETACSEQGGAAALESPELKEQLAAMGRRMAAQDYSVDCPAAERAENAVSVAADYRHVAGFYRCAAALQVMVLSRQRPSRDHILITAAEYAEIKERHG